MNTPAATIKECRLGGGNTVILETDDTKFDPFKPNDVLENSKSKAWARVISSAPGIIVAIAISTTELKFTDFPGGSVISKVERV